MADHATKARDGNVITSCVDGLGQNLEQFQLANGYCFNWQSCFREADLLPLHYVTSYEL